LLGLLWGGENRVHRERKPSKVERAKKKKKKKKKPVERKSNWHAINPVLTGFTYEGGGW